jgi:hypothetical protein
MPDEHRTTTNRRRGKDGLVAIRIAGRVYWVPTDLARKIEAMCLEQQK